jgi:CHAT domain-containing protein
MPQAAALLLADATVLNRMGRWEDSLRTAMRGAEIAGTHVRLTARRLPEREALAYASLMNDNLDLALAILAAHPDAGSDTVVAAWNALIRARALVLDEMGARHRALTASADPEIQGLVEDLRSAQQRAANLLVRGPGEVAATRHASLLADALGQVDRAEVALTGEGIGLGLRLDGDAITLSEVASRLPRGAGLLAYARVEGGDRPIYLAFVKRPDVSSAAVVSLGGTETIDHGVEAWRSEASNPRRTGSPDVAAYLVAGEALRKRIWDPVAPGLAGLERLFVVPDGSLNLINLAALPVGTDRYLIEDGPTLHLLSTERDLVWEEAPSSTGAGMLAIGAPDFGATSLFAALEPEGTTIASTAPGAQAGATVYRGRRTACRDFTSMRFQPLEATKREIEDVTDLWASSRDDADPQAASNALTRLTGDRASETAFKNRAPGNRILHVATHGFFLHGRCLSEAGGVRGIGGTASLGKTPEERSVAESPLRLSGLVLAGANHRESAGPDEDDGILTAEEIATLDLSATEWAVLSACDTGVGEVRAGEGVFGLRRATRIAGARTVIMSLWSVEDRAARDWMHALYRKRLVEDMETAEAVRAATLEVLSQRRAEERSDHPFFWAAFVASGDWK